MAASTCSSSGSSSAERRSSTSVQELLLTLIASSGGLQGPVPFVTATIGKLLVHSTGDLCLKAKTCFFLSLLVSRHPDHPTTQSAFSGQTRSGMFLFLACLAFRLVLPASSALALLLRGLSWPAGGNVDAP